MVAGAVGEICTGMAHLGRARSHLASSSIQLAHLVLLCRPSLAAANTSGRLCMNRMNVALVEGQTMVDGAFELSAQDGPTRECAAA